jgi:hypothetical protein
MSEETMLRLPRLHDHHSHVSLYASFEGQPDLGGLDRKAAFELFAGLPRDRLSLVKGWRTDRLALRSEDLAGLPPFIAVNASLHGCLPSPAAIPFLAALWPEFALHAADPAWGERNLPDLFAFYASLAGLEAPKLAAFMRKMEALGLGSLEDMTISGEPALRLLADSPYSRRIFPWATVKVYRALSPESRRSCSGVKIFLDGSLGARSAALDEPFADGSRGFLLYSDAELLALLAELSSYGAALSAHAIGHEAIEQALRCLEGLAREGQGFPSIRLEHAQFISLDQAKRCREGGIALSVQPNFSSDSVDYADRLSPRHRRENNSLRMLIDEAGFVPGADLIFGSDGMPHGPEYALQWSLFPAYEEQRLSLPEFEAGYGPERGKAQGAEGEGSAFSIDYASRRVKRLERNG